MWWVNATLQYYIRTRTRIPFGAMHDPALAARAHTLTQNHASHVHAQNTLYSREHTQILIQALRKYPYTRTRRNCTLRDTQAC